MDVRQIRVATWIRGAFIVLGVLALAALIWWVGPLLSIADVRPLDSAWVRIGLILLVVVAAAAAVAVTAYRRRQAAAALEQGISEGEDGRDAEFLREAMADALAALRKASGSRANYLYELPWYILIGPPGSGKTTALANSGLKFPLAHSGTPEAIAGVGGTRYCDWWFAENAVLIDTAGRYTTQDSDPKADRGAWLTFLDLLKRNRPRQPINGVLLAISIEDLITCSQEELAAHATAIRKRLVELQERLEVSFPVYALFTKVDLVAGFREFFGHLNEAERRIVWGATFQTDDKTRNMIADVPGEFDALMERLNEQVPDRLQGEPNPAARAVLFSFPSQMAALKGPLVGFLNRIFEPTRYHATATLRGFYFTSGVQQGTPIDQLVYALAKSFGAQNVTSAAYSGTGKSYFLTDLLNKVVFGEAGWVSTNRAMLRQAMLARAAVYAGLAAVSLTLAGLWLTSYFRNRELISQTREAVRDYVASARQVLAETAISDRNFLKVRPLLDKMRDLPAGYATRGTPVPIWSRFGLSQHERLRSAAEISYGRALERMFRSRLIYRLEEQIEAKRNDTSFIYEALKVYMMLGKQVAPDRDLIVAWMRRDWAENLYPGSVNAKERQSLEGHLVAMLELERGDQLISLDGRLVEDSQRTLARLSIAERAYELLKSRAKAGSGRDWVAAERGKPDAGLVFATATGEALDRVRVPHFFTNDGFHRSFVERLGDVGTQVEREAWVLGDIGKQEAVRSQYDKLGEDVFKLYARDFTTTWLREVQKLKLRPLTADKPKYAVLAAASAPTSPIAMLLESIRDETKLSPEPSGGRREAANETESAVRARLIPTSSAEPSEAAIEAAFRRFHVVVEGERGRRPVDMLIQTLSDIHRTLLEAGNAAQAPQAQSALNGQIASLKQQASRFPSPFSDMLNAAAAEFERDATGASLAKLGHALGDQVTQTCNRIVSGRYPFTRNGRDVGEVPMVDFGRLFAPRGILDRFFAENLASFADQSGAQWSWRQDSLIARRLSPATLREFQRAAEIRDAFFQNGGNVPSIVMAVQPLTLSGEGANAKLEINETSIAPVQGISTPVNLQWPGSGMAGLGRTALTLNRGLATPPAVIEEQGAWSLYRMLDRAQIRPQRNGIVARFSVEGHEVLYQFTVSAISNPLTLPALHEFRCPSGI